MGPKNTVILERARQVGGDTCRARRVKMDRPMFCGGPDKRFPPKGMSEAGLGPAENQKFLDDRRAKNLQNLIADSRIPFDGQNYLELKELF